MMTDPLTRWPAATPKAAAPVKPGRRVSSAAALVAEPLAIARLLVPA